MAPASTPPLPLLCLCIDDANLVPLYETAVKEHNNRSSSKAGFALFCPRDVHVLPGPERAQWMCESRLRRVSYLCNLDRPWPTRRLSCSRCMSSSLRPRHRSSWLFAMPVRLMSLSWKNTPVSFTTTTHFEVKILSFAEFHNIFQ